MKKFLLNGRGKALGLGFLAALLASACCFLPPLLFLTGAGALAALVSNLEGVFLAASTVVLLGGSVLLLRTRSGAPCCPVSRPGLSPPRMTLLLLATFGLSYAAFQGVAPALAVPSREIPPTTTRAESRVLDLQIQGMTCASCTVGIEAVLRAKPGVEEAKVDFGSASARVVHDASRISTQEILETVRQAGYKAGLSGARAPSSVVGGCC